MTFVAAAGPMADPSASWLKFVTIGNNGSELGFSSVVGATGSIAYTNRVGGKVATRFVHQYDIPLPQRFTFQIDETNSAGFNFTRLLVENSFGAFVTFLKADAVEYSGFPIAGWIWTTPEAGDLWALVNVGEVKRIYIQR